MAISSPASARHFVRAWGVVPYAVPVPDYYVVDPGYGYGYYGYAPGPYAYSDEDWDSFYGPWWPRRQHTPGDR
jgi:hypothetical protein